MRYIEIYCSVLKYPDFVLAENSTQVRSTDLKSDTSKSPTSGSEVRNTVKILIYPLTDTTILKNELWSLNRLLFNGFNKNGITFVKILKSVSVYPKRALFWVFRSEFLKILTRWKNLMIGFLFSLQKSKKNNILKL